MAQTLAEYGQRSPLELLATCLLMLLILVPLVTVTEVSRAMGSGVLGRLLLAPPDRAAAPEERVAHGRDPPPTR